MKYRSRLSEKIIQDVFIIVSATRRRRNIKNTVVSVGLCMEKFNIVSNNHERTHKRNFPVFDRKFPLQAILVKKNQNCQLETPSLVKEAKRSAIIVSAALRELWDYNTSRNSMSENPVIKVYRIRDTLKQSTTHYKQKTEMFLVTRSPTC